MKLTVFFDGSFWCGLVEETDSSGSQIIKHIFGQEPKDTEILFFVNQQILKEMENIPRLKPKSDEQKQRRINPKRMQRMVSKEKNKPVYSTKAQALMKETLAIKKSERKQVKQNQKLEEQQQRFEQKQAKKLQKKKGH